ncbi:MAG: methyltransferase domain-containing protein [Desulfobacterales bacterium]|jgi:2-polyprenyl-3-methyl-5-hydroxy-6-metoxy-1,4-benzoquinol methylase
MPINASVFHKSMKLDEGRLEQSDSECPFCRSKNRQKVYTLQENPEVFLLLCNECYAVSASRMPTDEALAEYYSKYYDSTTAKTYDSQITLDKPERLARNLVHLYNSYIPDKVVSILDFGGGDGTISHLAGKQIIKKGAAQVKITVVEYGTKIVNPQDHRIVIERVNSLDDIVAEYGLVIASAVIEHYPHPRALLRNLLQCMEVGGIIYARTPYIYPIMKLLQPIGVRVDFTFPGHLHDLGQSFWEGYFMREQSGGFQILQSRPSIVETTFRKHFLRTVAAHLLKAPWYLLGKSYKFVGGWEIFVQKN